MPAKMPVCTTLSTTIVTVMLYSAREWLVIRTHGSLDRLNDARDMRRTDAECAIAPYHELLRLPRRSCKLSAGLLSLFFFAAASPFDPLL